MSLTVALSTAVSGLLSNQQAIAATSENIANVNVENFSRREATFYTDAIPNQFAGVSVEIVRAGADRFLQANGYDSQSDAASLGAIADALGRIEASLGTPGQNVDFANALNQAYAAFAELSATPSSDAAKAVAISRLDAAFDAFSRTISTIDNEALASDQRIEAQTGRANALIEDIYRLNQIVPESNGAGDEIDARLQELSTLINISVARADDGRVTVSTANGRLLANAGGYNALGFTGGIDGAITLSTVDPATGARTLASDNINASVTGGEIGGLLQLRNDELPALRDIVVGAAGAAASEINAVYAGNASVGAATPQTTPLIVATAGGFSVNAVIAADPAQLAIARPGAGASGGLNDGSGAGAIAALGNGAGAAQAREALTQIGAATRIAADRSATAQSFADAIETRRLSETGVNLDEELSNLILYQRSYGANARVISAIDELYQSLLSIL